MFVLQPDQYDSDTEDGILPFQLDSWEDSGNALLTPSVDPYADNSGDLKVDLDDQASKEFLAVNIPNVVDIENNPFASPSHGQASPSPSANDEFAGLHGADHEVQENPNEGIAESNGASSNCFKTQDQVTISKYGRERKPKQDKIYEYY